jgi:hypothetical protein
VFFISCHYATWVPSILSISYQCKYHSC